MPIYEYECQKCGHTLEALQKFSDKPLRECPECGRHQLKRLVSAPLFRLAGSGWYETDFKSDKERKRNIHERGDKEPPPPTSTDDKASKPAPVAKTDAAATGKPRTMVTKPAKAAVGRKPKPAAKKSPPGRAKKR